MSNAQQRKNKFILADPSAIHTGGHHFEYAVRILLEAMDQGYEPELWAHKEAKLPEDLFEVKKCFTNSFYQNMGSRKGGRVFKLIDSGQAFNKILSALVAYAKAVFFKIMLETPLGVAVSRVKHDGALGLFRPHYNASYNEIKTSKVMYAVLYGFYKLYKFLYTKQNWLKIAFKVVVAIIIIVLLPILIPLGIMVLIYLLFNIQKDSPELIFANNLRAQLLDQDWHKGDIIFIPTCFFVEAGAMVELLSRWLPERTLPQFHLLFRTNVFVGHTNEFRQQLEHHLPYRAAFKWLFASAYKSHVYCYTDTPQLSQQYKVLTDEWFTPLPVPVPWSIDNDTKSVRKKPLTIAYVGDVRDEKGYHYYPEMIDHLWDDYIKTGDVRFKLQSNYADNLDVSRCSAVAQSILSGYDSNYVEHVKGPLSSEGYKSLIDDSDIILLTYLPEHYMARSSGIFIEAMKAGKPVVMPAKTWMAAQVEKLRQDRWKDAIKNCAHNAKLSNAIHFDKWTNCSQRGIRYVIFKAQFDIPAEETGFIEVKIRAFNKDNILLGQYQVVVAQIDQNGEVYVLSNVTNDYDHFDITYKLYGTNAKANDLAVYHSNKAWEEARDFGAVIYPYQEQNYINEAIMELIDHYDQYALQAKLFTDTKGDYFTPKNLVENIISCSQKRRDM